MLYKKAEGGITFDLHYNKMEYLNFNNQILETINKNYIINEILIEIDRSLYNINTLYQIGTITKDQISKNVDNVINEVINKNKELLKKENIDLKNVALIIKKYLNNRKPYDFYYIGKDKINDITKNR